MVCTAFKASADNLSQTSFGDLQQMRTKIEQLYLTMASILKHLQGASNFKDQTDVFYTQFLFLFRLVTFLLCK